MPTPEETKTYFRGLFDRTAPTYDAVAADFFTPFGRRLVDLAGIQPGWNVLDVGTGRGAVLRPAADAVGPTGSVHGVDLSPVMVEKTSRELIDAGIPHARVEVGDAENPPELAGGWDAVTAGLVVFFLPDGATALSNWRARIRSNGVLAMSTFAHDDKRWDPVFDAFRPHLPEHVTPSQLPPGGWHRQDESVMTMLTDAGFASIRSTTEVFTTTFRDAEHWIDFSYSNGMRAYWEAVSDETRGVMRADVAAAIDELADSQGSLTMDTGVRFTTARA